MSGVMCDKRVSARMKGKLYKTVVKPAVLYGSETVALKKRHEAEVAEAEVKMFSFSLGEMRMDRTRNTSEGQHVLGVLDRKSEWTEVLSTCAEEG